MSLRVRQGGDGAALLVLLHGLGGTGDVFTGWRPELARRWPGRWLAPDLPGHGGSERQDTYSFDGLAATVSTVVDPAGPTVVFGHSLGGAVGLALAARLPAVRAVIGLGVKVVWTADELDRARALAQRPPAWFDTRAEAADRYLRVAGLTGLIAPDDPAVDPGLCERDGRWGLALDPGAFAVGAPDMAGLIAGTAAAVVLARGANDAMNTDEQLAALGVPTVTLPGLGHSAHVEDPPACLNLVVRYAIGEP